MSAFGGKADIVADAAVWREGSPATFEFWPEIPGFVRKS